MEVIGGIASFIAIGQLLATTPRLVDGLKSLANTRQDLLELLNEVEILHVLGSIARNTINDEAVNDAFSRLSTDHPALLRTVEADLKFLVSQLEDLLNECQRGMKDNGETKVSRIKWLRHKQKIAALRSKTAKTREKLQFAFSCTTLFASTSNGKMLMDIHAIMSNQATIINTHQLMNEVSTQTDQNNSDDLSSSNNGSTNPGPPGVNTSPIIDSLDQLDLSRDVTNGGHQLMAHTGEDTSRHEPLIQITATLRRSCPRNCGCQCHNPTSSNPCPLPMLPIYGLLQYTYNSLPWLGRKSCDLATCERARSPVYFNLRLPLKFYSQVLEAKIAIGSVLGVGSSFHLRVSRQISFPNGGMVFFLRDGRIRDVQQALSRREFSPFDMDGRTNVFHWSVSQRQYAIADLLLRDTEEIFRGTDIGRTCAIISRRILFEESPNPRYIGLLKRLNRLDDGYAAGATVIHEVVRGRGDVFNILKATREGINNLDSFGRSPLQWAALFDDSRSVESLLSHGADPDLCDFRTITALMISAYHGYHDCARVLIENGCDLDVCDRDGQTALWYAILSMQPGSSEIVRMMLDHGASTTSPSYVYSSVIFALASHPSRAGPEEVEKKFDLLVQAGADIWMKDQFGFTPLDRALKNNQIAMIRLLLNAGCHFNSTNARINALHTAATYGMSEGIHILNDTKFVADVRVRRRHGRRTPLDKFVQRMEAKPHDLERKDLVPDGDDVEEFRTLIADVRDRYLKAEIRTLSLVIRYIRAKNYSQARKALEPVIQDKLYWDIPTEYRTFRAIDVQIREQMAEAAIESLVEFIEVSRDRMETDPFDDEHCTAASLEYDELEVEED